MSTRADVHARFNMACAYGVHDFDPEPHPEWPGCAEWVNADVRAETRADTRARRATRIPATRAAYARTRRARRHH